MFHKTCILSLIAGFPSSSFLSRPPQDFHPDIPRGKKELIPQAWVISETNQDPQKKDSRRDEKGSVEPKCPVQPLTIDWLDNIMKHIQGFIIILLAGSTIIDYF